MAALVALVSGRFGDDERPAALTPPTDTSRT
jgi:hypothetical protein